MASPFQYFRKNSGTLMAITVVLSMFAFTLDSLFSADGANFPLLGLLGGAVVLCLFGIRSGKILQYAAIGGVIGFMAGWIIPATMASGKVQGVNTAIGLVTKDDVNRLVQNRNVANNFVQMIGGPPREFIFISDIDKPYDQEHDVLLGELLRKEADEMGIVVNDAAVNNFIRQASRNQMTAEQFKNVRKQFGNRGQSLTEEELYDILRDEIKARLAHQMVVPNRGEDKLTPERYWSLYKRLNVSQEIVAAGLPVATFLDQVSEPSESDLKTLFDQYSKVYPNSLEAGSPGFRQRKKMRVVALEADYATIESSLPELTDAEIQKYYDDNKDREFTDSFIQDDTPAPADEMPVDDPALGSETLTEPTDKDATAAEGTETPKPADAKPADAKPEGAKPEGDSSPAPKTEEEPAASAEPEKTPATETPVKETPAKEAEAGSDSEPDNIPEPQADDENEEVFDDTPPAATEPVRYLPLTDDLKDEIRGRINRERTLDALNERSEAAIAKMRELSEKYILDAGREASAAKKDFDPSQNADKIASELKAWGVENGLQFVRTPLVTFEQFIDEEEYPIGGATEPMTDDFSNQNMDSIAVKLFSSSTLTYIEARAEDQLTNNQFAYWVTEVVEPKVAAFEDEGIREQVVEAWKTIEARPIAKQRADQLLAKVEAAITDGKTMSDALADETIGGKTEGVIIAVRNAPRFSWMRRSPAATNSFMPRPPVMSQVIGVDGVDRNFMQYVFEDLKDGEVGVVANGDVSNYYIVQAINRTPASEENLAKLRDQFMRGSYFNFMSPVAPMVYTELLRENSNWTRQLEAKYDFDWNQYAAIAEDSDE